MSVCLCVWDKLGRSCIVFIQFKKDSVMHQRFNVTTPGCRCLRWQRSSCSASSFGISSFSSRLKNAVVSYLGWLFELWSQHHIPFLWWRILLCPLVKSTLLTALNKKSIKERSKWNYVLLQGLHKEPLPAAASFSKPHIRNKQHCFQRIHLIPAGQGQLRVVRSVLTFRNGSNPDSVDPLP